MNYVVLDYVVHWRNAWIEFKIIPLHFKYTHAIFLYFCSIVIVHIGLYVTLCLFWEDPLINSIYEFNAHSQKIFASSYEFCVSLSGHEKYAAQYDSFSLFLARRPALNLELREEYSKDYLFASFFFNFFLIFYNIVSMQFHPFGE